MSVQVDFCRFCKLRIRWYPSWDTWGRASATQKAKFRCHMRAEGVAHEPEED